jgi:hypothetical protein
MAKYKYGKKQGKKLLLTGKRASRMLREAADAMGLDLRDADLEKTRKILSKGTPLSKIIIEMRGRT